MKNLNNFEAAKINNMQMILGGDSFAVHNTTWTSRENGVVTGTGCDTGYYTLSYNRDKDISDEKFDHKVDKPCQ